MKPNFWFNLPATEHTFIHVEDVLPPLVGLHETFEARHPTLPLVALLARGQADVNSHYTLLDASFFVQLSKSFQRNLIIFELFVEIFPPFNQAVSAPLEQVRGIQQVG